MPASVPRLRLERRIREFGVSVDSPRVQSALDDFEVIAAMSAGAVHDALMSRENINHAAYLAIGDEPPLDIIAAFDARWSLVGLAA